jgi:hypothetical protein
MVCDFCVISLHRVYVERYGHIFIFANYSFIDYIVASIEAVS